MNIYEKLMDMLIAICIMILFPVIYYNHKCELLQYEGIQRKMEDLIDTITTHGYLSLTMYEQFYTSIDTSKDALSIRLEYEEFRMEPEYAATKPPTFTGKVLKYSYVVTEEEIRKELYEKGLFHLSAGGFIKVTVTFLKDNHTIYSGGEVRAYLSFFDYLCNPRSNLCDLA